MFFLNKTDEGIERYEISYDTKEVKKIKKEIEDNCTAFVHRTEKRYYGCYEPYSDDSKEIFDFEAKKIGEVDYIDHKKVLYQYDWNEYELPEIYNCISILLGEYPVVSKANAAMEILLYKSEEEQSLNEKILIAKNALDGASSDNLEDLEEKLKKYKFLLYLNDKNKDVKPIGPYIEELKKLIEFKMVDFIPIEEYERIQRIFNVELKTDYGYWGPNASDEYIETLKRALIKPKK